MHACGVDEHEKACVLLRGGKPRADTRVVLVQQRILAPEDGDHRDARGRRRDAYQRGGSRRQARERLARDRLLRKDVAVGGERLHQPWDKQRLDDEGGNVGAAAQGGAGKVVQHRGGEHAARHEVAEGEPRRRTAQVRRDDRSK